MKLLVLRIAMLVTMCGANAIYASDARSQMASPTCSPCVSESDVRAWLADKGYPTVVRVWPTIIHGVWGAQVQVAGKVDVVGVDVTGRIAISTEGENDQKRRQK